MGGSTCWERHLHKHPTLESVRQIALPHILRGAPKAEAACLMLEHSVLPGRAGPSAILSGGLCGTQ